MPILRMPEYTVTPKKKPAPKPPAASTWLEPKTGGALVPYTPTISYLPARTVPGGGLPSNTITDASSAGGYVPQGAGPPKLDPSIVAKNWQDYYNEATGTQAWQEANQAYTSTLGKLKTQGQSAVNTVLANLGFDISKQLQDPQDAWLSKYFGQGGDFTLDPTAMAAAASNPLSSRAQIEKTYNEGSLDALYAANARGTAGSGASTSMLDRLLQNKQLSQYQVQNEALANIRNAITGYSTAQDTAGQNLRNRQDEIMRTLASIPGATYEAGTATENPASAPLGGGTNTAASAAGPTKGQGVHWGAGTAYTPQQLARLLAPGVSYATWAANHPAAARQLQLNVS